MKNDRQEVILSIIDRQVIETQEQLIAALQERGIDCTQATVSRDIKQLRLVKEPIDGGRARYAVSVQRIRLNVAERLKIILHESIVSVDYAQNIVVLKTMPGLANAAAAAFDSMENSIIVGTIAGDDTVIIVVRDAGIAEELSAEIGAMRK